MCKKREAKRDRKEEKETVDKQYFKYQMTHLMGDILSSYIQSVSHVLPLI